VKEPEGDSPIFFLLQSALTSLESLPAPTDEDLENKAYTLNNISQIYDARGDTDTALKYLEQSLKIRRQIGDKSGEGTTLNNIGGIYQDRGDNDKALEYLVQALNICRQIGDIYQEGVTCFNVAQILEEAGEIEEAVRLVERTVEIDRFTKNPRSDIHTQYLMHLKEKLGE
jgi:tetratricopeptide (TPR) repeat protein